MVVVNIIMLVTEKRKQEDLFQVFSNELLFMWESKGATTLAKKIIIEEGTRRGRIKEKNLDYRARESGVEDSVEYSLS